jgi:hypothetical protein
VVGRIYEVIRLIYGKYVQEINLVLFSLIPFNFFVEMFSTEISLYCILLRLRRWVLLLVIATMG